MYCVYTGINCLVVHLYNCVALLTVGLLSCSFHELYCLIDRHNICKFEECRL